jgi:hypothetical protein
VKRIKWKSDCKGYISDCGKYRVFREYTVYPRKTTIEGSEARSIWMCNSSNYIWRTNISGNIFRNLVHAKIECEADAKNWGYYYDVFKRKVVLSLPSWAGTKQKLFDTQSEADNYGAMLVLKGING